MTQNVHNPESPFFRVRALVRVAWKATLRKNSEGKSRPDAHSYSHADDATPCACRKARPCGHSVNTNKSVLHTFPARLNAPAEDWRLETIQAVSERAVNEVTLVVVPGRTKEGVIHCCRRFTALVIMGFRLPWGSPTAKRCCGSAAGCLTCVDSF